MANSTKRRRQQASLLLAWMCAGLFIFGIQEPVQANPISNLVNRVRDFFDPPRPDERRSPGNRVAGGGARGCLTQFPALPMVALIPQEEFEALTISEKPNLWFYSPYGNEILEPGRSLALVLSIKDNAALEEVYSQTLPFVAIQGIMHVQFPIPIEVGKTYEWDLNIACEGDSANNSQLANGIEGFIKRVEPDEELRECLETLPVTSTASTSTASEENQLTLKIRTVECHAQANLWYDTMTGIAELSCETDYTDWAPLFTQRDVELDEALEDFEDNGRLGNSIDADEALTIITTAPLASFCGAIPSNFSQSADPNGLEE